MANIIDYVQEFGGNTFAERSFSEVDGLIMSELSYINWDGIVPSIDSNGSVTLGDAITQYFNEHPYTDTDKNNLLKAVQSSERFSNMEVSNFEKISVSTETARAEGIPVEQHSAVTFSYDRGDGVNENFLAYRGTDNSIEGWRENFNMAFESDTAAQKAATRYADAVAAKTDGPIRMGGHSKGGNSSNYAFLHCSESTKDRVTALYAYDSPGMLTRDAVKNERYLEMTALLDGHAYAPQDSVIGQLLTQNEYNYVCADSSEGFIMEHDGMNWNVDTETGKFVAGKKSALSIAVNDFADSLVYSMPDSQRKRVVDRFFDYIEENGCKNFDDVSKLFSDGKWMGTVGDLLTDGNLPTYDTVSIMSKVFFMSKMMLETFLVDWAFVNVPDWIEKTYNEFCDAAADIIIKIGDGIEDFCDSVWNWAKNIFNKDDDKKSKNGATPVATLAAATVKVNADTLADTADLFENSGAHIEMIMGEMLSKVDQIRHVWRGPATECYVLKFVSFRKDVEKMNRRISEHTNDLRTIANNYRKNETENEMFADMLCADVII